MLKAKKMYIGWIALLFVLQLLFIVGVSPVFANATLNNRFDYLFSLTLQELMSKRIIVPVTIANTSYLNIPGEFHQIQAADIALQGYRDLNETLEFEVAGIQRQLDHFRPPAIGARGKIGHHRFTHKVNGVELRHRAARGSIFERDIPLLGDIRSIGVVTGPAGSVQGSGALSGVIDINTHSGLSFQGQDIKLRQSIIDQYTTAEMRYGKKYASKRGLFFYAGIAKQSGSNDNWAPFYSSKDNTLADGRPIVAGESLVAATSKFRNFDGTKKKLLLQLNYDDWEFTGRYTHGGTKNKIDIGLPIAIVNPLTGNSDFENGIIYEYQNFLVSMQHNLELNENWALLTNISNLILDFGQTPPVAAFGSNSNREEQTNFKTVLNWKPNNLVSMSAGTEYSHFIMGKKSINYGHGEPTRVLEMGATDAWSIDNYSLFTEAQYSPIDSFWLFAGVRKDWHDQAESIFSPRISLGFQPEKSLHKLRLTYSQSHRYLPETIAENLERANLLDFKMPADKLSSLELNYDGVISDELIATAAIWRQTDKPAYDAQGRFPGSQMDVDKAWGIEFGLTYERDKTRFRMGHTYVDPRDDNFVPTSIGSRHNTKITTHHQLNNDWLISGAFNIVWGYPDFEDFSQTRPAGSNLSTDPGGGSAFDAAAFLNLGASKKLSNKMALRIDAKNILALHDKKLSRRNILNRSDFQTDPFSLQLSFDYQLL